MSFCENRVGPWPNESWWTWSKPRKIFGLRGQRSLQRKVQTNVVVIFQMVSNLGKKLRAGLLSGARACKCKMHRKLQPKQKFSNMLGSIKTSVQPLKVNFFDTKSNYLQLNGSISGLGSYESF